MKLIKLTQKQADEIERIKRIGFPTRWKDNGWYIERDEALNGLSFYQYINAVLKGYEVEPGFNDGDYIVSKNGIICKIVKEQRPNEYRTYYVKNGNVYSSLIGTNSIDRHATKQEVWWAENGRDVWHLRENDILNDGEGNSLIVDRFYGYGEEQRVLFKCDSFDFMTNVRDLYKVICFAEDRKDV